MAATKSASAKPATPKTAKTTTTRSKSAAPAAPRKTASKVTAKADAPAPAAGVEIVPPVIASASPAPRPAVQATEVLKFRALVEQVVKTSGAKKKVVKDVVEATLEALGQALSKGHDLHLPPLGRARVGRQKGDAEGEMIVVKLKRGGVGGAGRKSAKKDATEGLAVAEE